jgi:hypothetical protein
LIEHSHRAVKLPRHFLDHWLRAFEKSRVDNHSMVTRFIERLESTLPDDSRPGGGITAAYRMGGGWRSSPDSQRSLWQTLRLAWQERRYLRKTWPHEAGAATWLVADDRRSGVIEGWTALSDQLRTFGGATAPYWLRQWQSEGSRLICFTPNLLALRPLAAQETTHLSYLSLFAVPLAWPGHFVAAAYRMLSNQPLGAFARKNAWITTLLAASFDVLMARQLPDRLLMITSNSFVIELLRYMHAASGRGEGVTEVLHGIPSIEIETYHQDMMGFPNGGLSGRIRLVPPVPGLRVNTAGGHVLVEPELINLKMNAVSRQIDLSALAKECVRRDEARGRVHVVTLNGAGTVEGKHYLQTGCFAAEQAIVRHMLGEARRLGLAVHVQYSLHPAHIKSGDAQAIREVLAVDGVEILEDSMQSWLESDLCVSIFSSASWDALALGCDVVFGVTPADQLYSSDMLASFAHPTRELTLFEVLSQALSHMPGRSRPSPHDRVARITGTLGGLSEADTVQRH